MIFFSFYVGIYNTNVGIRIKKNNFFVSLESKFVILKLVFKVFTFLDYYKVL